MRKEREIEEEMVYVGMYGGTVGKDAEKRAKGMGNDPKKEEKGQEQKKERGEEKMVSKGLRGSALGVCPSTFLPRT